MKTSKLSIILNVILLFAVAVLYYLHFKPASNKQNSRDDIQISNLTNTNIVYMNSDTVWNKYKFVLDKKKDLQEYEERLQNQYNSKAQSFKREYEDYLKEGTSGKLSLSEQKKREEELSLKQRDLTEFDKKLSEEFIELQQKLNNEIQDSITNFIKKHYAKNNFNYVMAYSRSSGILYANNKFDITKDLVNNLNKAYEARISRK